MVQSVFSQMCNDTTDRILAQLSLYNTLMTEKHWRWGRLRFTTVWMQSRLPPDEVHTPKVDNRPITTVTCHSRHSVSRLCVPVLPAYLCKIARVTRKLRRKNRLTMHFCKLFSRNMASNLPELIVLKRADENWKSSVYRVLYQIPLIKNRFHPVHCNQIVLLFVNFRELWPLT